MHKLVTLLDRYIGNLGLAEADSHFVATLTGVVLVLAITWGVYLLLNRVVGPLVTRFVAYTEVKWDDVVFNPDVLRNIWKLILAILLQFFLPDIFLYYPASAQWMHTLCKILVVLALMMTLVKMLSALFELFSSMDRYAVRSFKGLCQLIQLVVIISSVIIVASMMIGRDPLVIVSGLSAMAAVLMLVFQDTIIGFIAGVQLTANDMLRPGDWICAPKSNVNGVVQEVTLTTVKIQNFDMTIVTVPPYTLVKDSFQNWRGMQESGGRRVMRSFNIDMTTVREASAEELALYVAEPWWKWAKLDADQAHVNLTLLRRYLEWYIGQLPTLCTGMTWMVRELQPTADGLPVELYFFTSNQEWVKYEKLQADVTDHILARINRFGLRIFQKPTGADIRVLAREPQKN